MSQEKHQPTARRRVKLIYLILLPILAIVASVSFWLQTNFATIETTGPADPSKRSHPLPASMYNVSLLPVASILDDKLNEVLARLEHECIDITSEVARVDQALREQNPHLDAAIKDPAGTALAGPQSQSTSQIYSQCKPIVNEMVDEFLHCKSEDREKSREIEPALRHVLLATVTQAKVEREDLDVLARAFDGGITDPLVLSCLVRGTADDLQKPLNLADVLFQNRKKRPMSAATTTFVYASISQTKPYLSFELDAEATAEGIQEFANAWQWAVKKPASSPYQRFLFAESYKYSTKINGFAIADLLIEFDRRKSPEIPSEVKHLIAYQITESLLLNYRGSNFISRLPNTDTQIFESLSAKAIKHLAIAWTITPQYETLPALLMALEMRSGATGHSVDFWFQHSIAAAVDSELAFKYFASFIESSRTNSRDIALAFAEKCVSSDIEKSNAFFGFAVGVNAFASYQCYRCDLGKDQRLVKIAKQAVKQLQTYSMAKTHEQIKPKTLSTVIGLLWQAGEFAAIE